MDLYSYWFSSFYMKEKKILLPMPLSFCVAIDLALSSCSSQCSFSSLRVEALSWPSTSAALLRLVTARRSLSAASLIFSSRWICCRSTDRAASKRCWNSGSRISHSSRFFRFPFCKTITQFQSLIGVTANYSVLNVRCKHDNVSYFKFSLLRNLLLFLITSFKQKYVYITSDLGKQ